MEIARLSGSSIRIKTKNAILVIDPQPKTEADAYLFTSTSNKFGSETLSIYGPGEFEVKGVSIKGEKVEDFVCYDFLDESKRILVLPNLEAAKSRETEEYDAVIVNISQKTDDSLLSNIGSELLILYGDSSLITLDQNSVKKTEKINLKKADEFKGFTVFLEK